MTTRPATAIIPIKRFENGKSRLGERLSADDRAQLSRRMFEHVLLTSLGCDALHGALVVTDAPELAKEARARGADVLDDRDAIGSKPVTTPRLAALVDAGLAHLRAQSVSVALVLMADLPRILAADLVAMLTALNGHDLALAPDLRGTCTNALALRLTPATREFRTAFGHPGSLQLHASAARALGLEVCVQEQPRLALDVDVPADLDLMAGLHHDD